MSTPGAGKLDGTANPGREVQFRLFAETISNLAWIADADGWIFWYNQRWYEYTGTTPDQMEGWGWQSVHHPDHLPKVLESWAASIATGEPFDMTFPLKGADGKFRPFLTRITPYRDESGRLIRWFGTNTDVSREVQSNIALGESEQRFRTAAQAIDAILWTNDAEGKMEGEQPGWSSFTGQTYEQYRGYGWSSAVHPEDAQPTVDAWERCVAEHCLFAFEHRVLRHDGRYRLCSIRALPIPNEDGSIREWVGVHTDITDERNTQHELREAVQALNQEQELVEAAQLVGKVGFWRYQPAMDTIYISKGSRHLLELPATGRISTAEMFGSVHPEDMPAMRRALDEALVTGHYRIEFRTRPTLSGDIRWLLAAANVVAPPNAPPYLVGINLDITQQKLSSEALLRSEKLAVAGRLAASIAHEINNPLEAITNLTYLLLTSPLDPEQRELAETLQSELARVAQITTHTLRFHRQSTRATAASPSELIDSVLALHAARIRNASIQTMQRLRADTPIVGFDGELRQVLANLVLNAIDAMGGVHAPRNLYLRTRDVERNGTRPAGVMITVADTGCGMSLETLNRIFDAFFTTKGDTGNGLGLWVSIEIVKKHKGTLRVRSSQGPKHHGSIFQLFLPYGTTAHPATL